MKVVNLFIECFVISCLTLNSDIIAGCCGNKNNKGNSNSSNNNGSEQTTPSKKSNSTTTPPITTTTTTTNTTETKPETIPTGSKTPGLGVGASSTKTTTTGAGEVPGAGFGAGAGATTTGEGEVSGAKATTATAPPVKKITEIQNLGGINGLTARLEGNKIYLYLNGKKIMESVNNYNNDSISHESIENVRMKFLNGTPLASLPIYNGAGIGVKIVVWYINGANNIPLKNSLSGHNLMYGTFDNTNNLLVIDLNTFKAYKEITKDNIKHYFAYAQNEDKNWRNGYYFFTPTTSAYGYYNIGWKQYYWSNANGSSIQTPNGFNQYNFYKSKFESHTIHPEGA